MVGVGVHGDGEGAALGGGWDVDNPDDVGEVGIVGEELGENVGGCHEKGFVEAVAGVVGVKRKVVDAGFYEVLEEVGAEGDFGKKAVLDASDFDEHAAVVDVGVADGDAEADVVASPSAWTYQDERPPLQTVIDAAYHAGDLDTLFARGDGVVGGGVDVDDVNDVIGLAGGYVAMGVKEDVSFGDILRDANGADFGFLCLHAALEQVEFFSVAGKFHIDGHAVGFFQKVEPALDARGERS